jgi:WD40 repeat protein
MHESEPPVPATDLDDLRLQFDASGRLLIQRAAGTSMESNGQPAATVSFADQSTPIFSAPADNSCRYALLSPDGRLCAVIPRVRSANVTAAALEVWNVAENRRLWQLTSDDGYPLLAAVFSADGRRLLTQAIFERNAGPEFWQRRAVVWDVETGQAICDFSPPSTNGAFGEKVHARLEFSADNSRLVSCGASDGVTIWDATTGRELLTLGEFGGVITEAHFSRDGLLITRAQDGVIAVWDGREAR